MIRIGTPFILLLILISCSSKTEIEPNFTSNYWNLKVERGDTLASNNDLTLYFDNKNAYFGSNKIGSYLLNGDTLIISDTTYFDKKIIKNGIGPTDNLDITFHKYINNDSLYRVVYKYLKGQILKANEDSLVIKTIEGFGYPFEFNEVYKFYNDSLLYDPKLILNSIEFSTGLCYGDCPAFALKIDKDLNLEYWGGENSKKQGFFEGNISKSNFRSLEQMVRISNFQKKNPDYNITADAPLVELLINYNENQIKGFTGDLYEFPPRIREIGLEFFNLYNSSINRLDSTDSSINFQVEIDTTKFDIIQIPPPPEN